MKIEDYQRRPLHEVAMNRLGEIIDSDRWWTRLCERLIDEAERADVSIVRQFATNVVAIILLGIILVPGFIQSYIKCWWERKR